MTPAQRINRGLSKVPAWPLYILALVPPVWFFWLGQTGGLGPEPIKALEHEIGELALKLLIVVLAITPLRNMSGVNLVKFRRALGLVAFFYVVLHLLVWLVLDVGVLSRIWADILKRPYITVGMAGFLLLIPAAVTSNNWSIRRLGPKRWKRVHQVTYAAAILGAVHFIMVQKVWEAEPLVYLVVIAALLSTRLDWRAFRQADA